jgi:hypothetical protein
VAPLFGALQSVFLVPPLTLASSVLRILGITIRTASWDCEKICCSRTCEFIDLNRFVLFEQIPFRGDEEAITVAKNENLMKQHLDEIFMSHFPADELLKTGHELVIRFLVQWVLVRDPDARRFSFDLYLDRLTSR